MSGALSAGGRCADVDDAKQTGSARVYKSLAGDRTIDMLAAGKRDGCERRSWEMVVRGTVQVCLVAPNAYCTCANIRGDLNLSKPNLCHLSSRIFKKFQSFDCSSLPDKPIAGWCLVNNGCLYGGLIAVEFERIPVRKSLFNFKQNSLCLTF